MTEKEINLRKQITNDLFDILQIHLKQMGFEKYTVSEILDLNIDVLMEMTMRIILKSSAKHYSLENTTKFLGSSERFRKKLYRAVQDYVDDTEKIV